MINVEEIQKQASWPNFKINNQNNLHQNEYQEQNNQHRHQQNHISQSQTPVNDSPLSIYDRLRQFLYINFLLNKYSFILSILSYFSDLVLFISLNLYLFSNKNFLYYILPNNSSNILKTSNLAYNSKKFNISFYNNSISNETIDNNQIFSDPILKSDSESTKTIKQSYLYLQIFILFVFFICFILSYLIKLQFKYHRLAINLYDYDIETVNQQDKDRDGIDSLASTTTASHFSSSINRKISSLLKRALNRLFTKLASILLNFTFGYQFCQNCFIEQPNESSQLNSILIHFFILVCVLLRCLIIFLNKKNSMNQLSYFKKLQEKQKSLNFVNCNNNNNFNYYFSYYIKYNQNQYNQLKQHQNNKNTFRIFQLNDTSLFIGFAFSLFHLFSFLKSIELIFLFLPLLLTLILYRVKSILNASFNLIIFLVSILIVSSLSSFNSIVDISSYLSAKANNSLIYDDNLNISSNSLNNIYIIKNNTSSIITIYSSNIITFLSFLFTLYFKSILSIYYCSLTSIERWNISFLCNLSIWNKLSIYLTFLVYIVFYITCIVTLCFKYKSWSFLIIPFYLLLGFVWFSFQLLNVINLTHLMNKIKDCFLLLNESNSINNVNSIENSSNISKKSKSSHLTYNNNNRNSTLSQNSAHNNNNNNNNNSSAGFRFTKLLSIFLSYHKLNMHDESNNSFVNSINIPIHRILGYKGVRHLGSISYRISLYCFVQTCFLTPFAYNTSSPMTIGLYLITLSLNLIWISLLYQFPKSATGTCIAYALVAPPLILNIYNAATLGTNITISSALSTNNAINSSKKYKTNSSSSGSAHTSSTTTNTNTTTTSGNSLLFLPFNYQQALTQRCTYILNKMHGFLQFHLIENYGCDFASTGLNKESLELKLKSFFQKRSSEGCFYNTYILYYCGPTSALTDNLSFIDGNELSIEQIVDCWKEIHYYDADLNNKKNINNESINNIRNKNRRLILILDAENTNKSLQYIKTKLNENNIYVALQTVKYNYNSYNSYTKNNNKASLNKGIENRLILSDKKSSGKHKLMGPGSPQTMNGNFFDSYLNLGKFTLDWIKSNCNSFNNNLETNEMDSLNHMEEFLFNNNNDFDEEKEDNLERDDDDDDEDDDEEEDSIDYELNNKESVISQKKKNQDSSFFYEAKCAFSRHWTDYTFGSNDEILINDFNQFWNLYYPSFICKPILKLINCRLFYLKFEFIKKIIYFLRRLKNRIIPVHEFDTGHGFKLFSS